MALGFFFWWMLQLFERYVMSGTSDPMSLILGLNLSVYYQA